MFLKLLMSPVLFLLFSFYNPDLYVNWNPEGKNIPYSPADQKTPNFKIIAAGYSSKTIPHTSEIRAISSIGGIIPIAQSGNLQLNFGASFYNHADLKNSVDIIGWDGIILSDISYKYSDKLGLRLASTHFSGHLGDEFIKRSGWERVSYSRNETSLELWSKPFENNTSFLVKTGFDEGYDHDKNHHYKARPWRHQLAAFNLSDEKNLWKPFWAADMQFWQQDNFDPSFCIQAGVSLLNDKNLRTRAGLEYYHGKVNLTEFSGYRENYFGLALWVDF